MSALYRKQKAFSSEDTVMQELSKVELTREASNVPLIYLLDADKAQAELVATELQDNGFQVKVFTTISNFRYALQQQFQPDALVLDIVSNEGESSGLELLKELSTLADDLPPVVITSARDDLDARLEAHRAGINRYLTKPLAKNKLSDCLFNLIDLRPAPSYRVMLVDDDPLLLQAYSAFLQEVGIEVKAITSPEKTLQELSTFNPDVLVLDVYMPRISGLELASIIREHDAYMLLPILFLSSETDQSQHFYALNLGGDDYLTKPIQPAHLISSVITRAKRARQSQDLSYRLQQALYEREREHHAVNLHSIISVADVSGRITYVNDLFCQISGYQRKELLGQNHRIVKSGEHSVQFYKNLWVAISRGQVWHGEICNRRKDGSFYWVTSTITPLIGDNGKPYQYISVRTDITAQKLAEIAERKRIYLHTLLADAGEQLLAAEIEQIDGVITDVLGRFGMHFNIARAYLFLLNVDNQAIEMSHEWCAKDIMPLIQVLQAIPVETIPWFWKQIQQSKSVLVSDVLELPTEASAEKSILSSLGIRALCGFPLQRHGKSIGFIGFDHLETPRQWQGEVFEPVRLLANLINSALLRSESEQARNQSLAILNSTLESTKDGILAVDYNGKVLFMNKQFRDIWRLPSDFVDEVSDDKLLKYALKQLVSSEDYMLKVKSLYHSCEESQDMVVLKDGRVFNRYSRPLINYGEKYSRVWSFHDITERVSAEKEAETAKERLRRGQLYANIGTWEWNIVTDELFLTERIPPLFGYSSGELETSYENFLAAIHPDDRQSVIAAVQASVESDAPYDIEHRVVWPDGTVRWLLERGAVLRDDKGKALGMIGIVQDIHERKCTEIALAEREQQLLQAQQLAKLGHWQLEFSTKELTWSENVFRIFGYEPYSVEPTIELFRKAVHPEDLKSIEQSEKLAEQTGRHDVTHRIVLPDGRIRYVHELAILKFDYEGMPLRFEGTVQDLTERYETEQRLNESEQRFAFAVEGTGDGVWDWRVDTDEVSLSACYESMLGYQKGEIGSDLQNAWLAFVHPDDLVDAKRQMDDFLNGALKHYIAEFRMRCKNGAYIWILSRGTIVERDNNGRPTRLIGIHSDISQRKQLNFELMTAREQAEQANRAKSEFLSSMSHELRTPMNAILGFGQLLEFDETLAADHKDNVHEILKAGNHLLDLINEVLDLAKVESGSLNLSIEPVALLPVVEECESLISGMADRNNISLHLACPANVIVRADRTRLKQVLLNLLSNAIKYNRDFGNVELKLQVNGHQFIRILVQDTGTGIATDKLKGLFQPFNRLGVENSNIEGTGIGLTITRRIVEMMGGSIGVESELGVGSCFWIELPLEQQLSQFEEDKLDLLQQNSRDCCGEACESVEYKVLYIEDNPANIKLVTQVLATLPHLSLNTAHTSALGLELAMSLIPDLILLDINLPGMDGYQVIKVLKADPALKHIPVIAITANAMQRDIEKAQAAGFADYITKPLQVPLFLKSIKRHLQRQS